MTLREYTKPHATARDRIDHLCDRGLEVPERNVAAREIDQIGYERLRIYFISRRQPGVPNRPFVAGTTFKSIIRIYDCDAKIRDKCFSAVGRFEILFRNAISESLSRTHGSHPYHEPSAFKDSSSQLDALQSFSNVFSKSKDERAKHYRNTYNPPVLPPIWTMKEFLTFGQAARVYNNLSGERKNEIARKFNVPSDQVFTNWIACLVDLRNFCAHHDRLFNRSFQKQPSRLRRASIPSGLPKKLKAILECLEFLLASTNPRVSITSEVDKLIGKCSEIQAAEAGY